MQRTNKTRFSRKSFGTVVKSDDGWKNTQENAKNGLRRPAFQMPRTAAQIEREKQIAKARESSRAQYDGIRSTMRNDSPSALRASF